MESVGSPLKFALSNPWRALEMAIDGPLHPGGEGATRDLLDRAGVDGETRLVDAGCGAGGSVGIARERGASVVGLDIEPKPAEGVVRGDIDSLPFGDSTVDVVLSECSVCLSEDIGTALSEARRVLVDGGRLAVSDVTVEGDAPELPESISQALCLGEDRERESILAGIEDAGFRVDTVHDHREDLLAMRDEIKEKVEYERALRLMGEKGGRILDGINTVEAAIEDGRIGYVSVVAVAE